MKRLFIIMILVLSIAFLLSACGGGGGGGASDLTSGPTASIAGDWIENNTGSPSRLNIRQSGTSVTGYMWSPNIICLSGLCDPKGHFTGTITGRLATVTGPNGTFSATIVSNSSSNVTIQSVTSTAAFCGGAQSATNINYGQLSSSSSCP